MNFKIGQVEIRVGLPNRDSGVWFEVELSAPIGKDNLHVALDYMHLAKEPLRLTAIVTRGDECHAEESIK